MRPIWLAAPALCVSALFAQAPTGPVINPRGVINAFTQQPAPTTVAPGGLVWITGINLGPPEGAVATGTPLPTELAGVKVLMGNVAIPLLSVTPGRIVAQIPWSLNPGGGTVLTALMVEGPGGRSRQARFFLRAAEPGIRSAGDTGYGEAASTTAGSLMTLSATGLGDVEVDMDAGVAGPADLTGRLKAGVRAYVGGIPATVDAVLSPERVGEFDVKVEVPTGAQLGDVLYLVAGARVANVLTYGKGSELQTQFLNLPEGADLRAITGSDLNAGYVVANGARDAGGCYPTYVFDFTRKSSAAVPDCITSGNRNLVTPVVAVQDGTALAAFVGPPEGDAPNPVSSKVRIFNPAIEQPLEATLSGSAANLTSIQGDTVVAVIPGTPAKALGIDVMTGEVRDVVVGAGGGAAAGGAGPGAGAANNPVAVDLGDGLNHVLTGRIGTIQNRFVVIVGDDPNQPKRAKLAVLDQQNRIVSTREFPDGFLPLVGPVTTAAANQPGGGAAAAVRFRVSANYDANTRVYYVLSRKADNSADALVAFNFTNAEGEKALEFPEKVFAATCTSSLPLYSLELSRRLALMVTNVAENTFKQQCDALGYLTVDLNNQRIDAVPLAGAGHVNITSVTDMNDYLIGSNVAGRQLADTLLVLDGVTASASRLQLPPGITSFAGQRLVPAMGLIVAMGQRTVVGDEGFVVFDLENAETRILPVPEGFNSVTLVEIMPATRKLVARGNKPGGAGTQYMIYDLMTKELVLVPNPAGVTWVGAVPAAAPVPGAGGGGGQQVPTVYQDTNPKANSIAAVCFDSDRKQVGVMVVRVP